MAVTQTTTPYIIMGAQADVLTGNYKVSHIRWYNKAAIAGDDLTITDADGNVVLQDVADAENFTRTYIIMAAITNLTLSVLDRGTVFVYLAPKNRPIFS